MIKPICLWSGPRNVSTALMYSFAQRRDTLVVDEPLYGHYLRVSGADHPGRDDVLAAMNCDGNAVIAELLLQQEGNALQRLFIKHMAHHLIEVDLDFLRHTDNIFLVRDPREMLPSLRVQLPHATLADTGLRRQWELFSSLIQRGERATVLDSRELLLYPEVVLQKLCNLLSLDFDTGMLSWEAGPRAEDGVWAPHWYHAVHRSRGFSPYVPKHGVPEELQPLLDECKPWYDKLYKHALRYDAEGVDV